MSQASPVYQEVVYVRVFAMKLKAISEILSNAIVNALPKIQWNSIATNAPINSAEF